MPENQPFVILLGPLCQEFRQVAEKDELSAPQGQWEPKVTGSLIH